MCCFSGKVQSVNNTRIFARLGEHGKQGLIYSMSLSSKRDVAMVLPIPVATGHGESAVKFVDFSNYRDIFEDLEKGFVIREMYGSKSVSAVDPPARRLLPVVSVGAFDASYVPSIADFSRLDPRFVLLPGTWEKLPEYHSFGFAVFKLKAGNSHVHPMAFTFPSAMRDRIFFPTVHIHDGKVHRDAEFDHMLYCQTAGENIFVRRWDESNSLASQFTHPNKAHGLIKSDQHVYRNSMSGMFKNQDIIIGAVS